MGEKDFLAALFCHNKGGKKLHCESKVGIFDMTGTEWNTSNQLKKDIYYGCNRKKVFFSPPPPAERRPVFFGYCPRNKFVFLQPSAGGSSSVPASTCYPCNLSLLSISDMTSNLRECRVQRGVSIND